MIWQSYLYNPNMESQYLRARYYNVTHANFLTKDSYLGNITDPLTLDRYNYVKSSPVNYVDPSGHVADYLTGSSGNADPFPYGVGPQAEWYKHNYPELTRKQSNALEKIKDDISTADNFLATGDCKIIQISKNAWEYLSNAMLGVFVSIVKSGGDPFRVYAEVFWKVFGIDKDY